MEFPDGGQCLFMALDGETHLGKQLGRDQFQVFMNLEQQLGKVSGGNLEFALGALLLLASMLLGRSDGAGRRTHGRVGPYVGSRTPPLLKLGEQRQGRRFMPHPTSCAGILPSRARCRTCYADAPMKSAAPLTSTDGSCTNGFTSTLLPASFSSCPAATIIALQNETGRRCGDLLWSKALHR